MQYEGQMYSESYKICKLMTKIDLKMLSKITNMQDIKSMGAKKSQKKVQNTYI